MAGSEYLIRIRQEVDNSSVRAYLAQVSQAIKTIESQAAAAKARSGAGAITPAAQQQFTGEYARAQVQSQALLSSGLPLSDQAEVRQKTEQLARAGRAAGYNVVEGPELARAMKAAGNAEIKSAKLREQNAAEATVDVAEQRTERKAQKDARSKARAAKGPAGADVAEPATQVNAQTRLRDKRLRENLEDLNLPPLGAGESRDEGEIRVLSHQKVAAARKNLAATQASAEQVGQIHELQREEYALQRRNLAEQRSVAAGGTPGGTFFQRLSARTQAPGSYQRAPAEFPTGGQALGRSLLTTARFGASAALLYGGLNTLKEMVTTSAALEKSFNQIQRQFEATGKGGEFAGFQKAIFNISTATGEAAVDVAQVGVQMQGAFGNTKDSIEATTSAIKIARVTGLGLHEVIDSLTAAAVSFKVPVEDIGNAALDIKERFGVEAKETIQLLGDLAPVAAAAGLSLRQTNEIAGIIQKSSGRSGGVIAESLGRILPLIQNQGAKLVDVFGQNKATAGQVPDLQKELAAGRTGDVLLRITKAYSLLTKAQQEQIVADLGGSRNAQTLIPLFAESARLVADLGGKYNVTGKLQSYFSDFQETLTQRLAKLGRTFEKLGYELVQAGIGDILKEIVAAGGLVLSVFLKAAEAFAALNRATGGLAAKLLEVYLVLRLISALSGASKLTSGASLLNLIGLGGKGPLVAPAAKDAARVFAVDSAGVAAQVAPGLIPAAKRGVGGIAAGFAKRYGVAAAETAAATGIGASGIGTTVSGVLGAAGVGPGLIIAAGAIGTKIESDRIKRGIAHKAEAVYKQLAAADDATLTDIAKHRESTWTRVAVHYFHQDTQGERANKILAKRRFDTQAGDFDAARKGGFITGDAKDLDNLRKKADEGNVAAGNRIAVLLNQLQTNPEVKAKFEAFKKELTVSGGKGIKADLDESGGQQITATAQEYKQNWQSGMDSATTYFRNLDALIVQVQQAVDLNPADPAARKLLSQLKAQRAADFSAGARQLADLRIQFAQLSGAGPEATVNTLTALLSSGDLVDPEARVKAAHDIMAAQKQVLDEQVSMASSATEQARILREGIPIAPEVQVVLDEELLTADSKWNAFVTDIEKISNNLSNFAHQVADLAVKDSITLAEAARRIIAKRIEDIRAVKAAMEGSLADNVPADWQLLDAEESALQGALDKIPKGGGAAPKTQTGDAKSKKTADDAVHQEALANAKAKSALEKAQAEGDPVRQAELAIQEANAAIAVAKPGAEKLNAQAELVKAQRELNLAHVSMADAYRNIDMAMAEAAGDTVRVSQLEIEAASSHLDAARDRHDKMGELQAEAELIKAKAGAVQAHIAAGEERINFRKDMDQISTGQEIALYEQLRAQAIAEGASKKQVDDLTLKIHQLRKGLSQDLQFNIPSEIKLPTLYEVRRLRQTEAHGSAYQDNRQIAVQYVVQSPQDHQAALSDLVNVMSGQPRVGAAPRAY